jgi:hypothetical protein
MLKQRLLRTSPFLIFYVLGLLWIIYELIFGRVGADGWGDLAIYSVLPFIILFIVVDVVLKLSIKKSVVWLWVIEAFLSLALIYYWIVR